MARGVAWLSVGVDEAARLDVIFWLVRWAGEHCRGGLMVDYRLLAGRRG